MYITWVTGMPAPIVEDKTPDATEYKAGSGAGSLISGAQETPPNPEAQVRRSRWYKPGAATVTWGLILLASAIGLYLAKAAKPAFQQGRLVSDLEIEVALSAHLWETQQVPRLFVRVDSLVFLGKHQYEVQANINNSDQRYMVTYTCGAALALRNMLPSCYNFRQVDF